MSLKATRATAIFALIGSFLLTASAHAAYTVTARTSGTGSNINAVDFSSATLGIAVGDSGLILRTTDGGSTWTQINTGLTDLLYDVDFVQNTNTVFVVGTFGRILASLDGGLNWMALTSGTNEHLRSISARDAQSVVVGGDNGTLLVSTDWGQEFKVKNLGTNRNVLAVRAPSNSVEIWASLANSVFAFSADNGTTWTFPELPGTGDLYELLTFGIGPTSVGYAVGLQGKIARTVNNGAAWTVLTTPASVSTETLQGIAGNNSTKVLVVGTFGAMIITKDAGTTWTTITHPYSAKHLFEVNNPGNSNTKWIAVGSGGTILEINEVASTPPSAPTNVKIAPIAQDMNNSTSSTAPILSWTASTKGSTNVARYEVRVDSGSYTNVGNVTQYTLPVLANGLHTVRVQSIDEEGLTSNEAAFSFTVDAIAPTVSAPTPTTAAVGASTTFTISASDNTNGSYVNYCKLYVNGAEQGNMSLVSAQAGTYSRSYLFASAGTFALTARCWDNAGNSTTSAATTITLAFGGSSTPPITDFNPSAVTSSVSPQSSSVVADGSATTVVTVYVKNAAGQALANKFVALTSTRPQDTITAVAPTTNDLGAATFYIKSSGAGQSTVFATIGSTNIGSANVTFTESGSSGPAPVLQGTLSVGTLIKLACPAGADVSHPCRAVYFIGPQGKRHAFPNAKAYFTWYTDFSNINIVTGTEMASLPLGKNIVYRPGVRMVKFQTDPKVYVVSKGGVLRPIKSEAAAKALYGTNWSKQIDDVSDAFIGDYLFGVEVVTVSDYDGPTEKAQVDALIKNF